MLGGGSVTSRPLKIMKNTDVFVMFRDIWGCFGTFRDNLGHLDTFRDVLGHLGHGMFRNIWGRLGTFVICP